MFAAAAAPVFLTLTILTGLGSRAKTALAGTGLTVPAMVRSTWAAGAVTVTYPVFSSESLP